MISNIIKNRFSYYITLLFGSLTKGTRVIYINIYSGISEDVLKYLGTWKSNPVSGAVAILNVGGLQLFAVM